MCVFPIFRPRSRRTSTSWTEVHWAHKQNCIILYIDQRGKNESTTRKVRQVYKSCKKMRKLLWHNFSFLSPIVHADRDLVIIDYAYFRRHWKTRLHIINCAYDFSVVTQFISFCNYMIFLLFRGRESSYKIVEPIMLNLKIHIWFLRFLIVLYSKIDI